MNAIWILVFAYVVNGQIEFEDYVGPEEGIYYSSYDDCIADGAAYAQELIDAGFIGPDDFDGQCYLVSEPE